MPQDQNKPISTGLCGFDNVLQGLRPGDNIVWQVDSVDDYLPFLKPCSAYARENNLKPVYFHFAKCEPLLDENSGVEIHHLNLELGFEYFVKELHEIIDRTGKDGYYIFDCLSELAADWYSDRMLGNFFMLVCPYIYKAGAIAYFALLRNRHSYHTTTPILQTAQVFLDVYRHNDKLYVHPIKTSKRHSPTMNMIHVKDGENFLPVQDSVTITEVLSNIQWSRLDAASYRLGVWSSTFAEAEELQKDFDSGKDVRSDIDEMTEKLLRMVISRDDRLLKLARKYFSLTDILSIRKRMIGTGLIGGKSVGMLLARSVLEKAEEKWKTLLEPHDSFFIGSDVFYTFLVQNDLWWMRQEQESTDTFLSNAEQLRQRILNGKFPEYIVKQFVDLLDYFGQSPIVVRSSSLLEDNFGNAFAGKYDSFFCANQGNRTDRLEEFISAIRYVYASTISSKALNYRAHRGLLDKDEQMAILIQRVSGAPYGKYFFPQAAGVGFSFNPFVWSEYIEPEAGMLRLVFGLGTRAVDRCDDDYTRIVALNAPARRPEVDSDQQRRFSQHNVDVLDLEANELVSRKFDEIAELSKQLPLDTFATFDRELHDRAAKAKLGDVSCWTVTFDNLLSRTNFPQDMRQMLDILQTAYDHPLDIEFTTNFFGEGNYKINLVQCRPLELKGGGSIAVSLPQVSSENVVLDINGPVIGQNRFVTIDRIIYVVPEIYSKLPINERYSVARLIGKLTHLEESQEKTIMLIGPGRWGTTTPSLGVPVSFEEINKITVLCEITAMSKDILPDASLGTHFFSDLIEMDILYLGMLPGKEKNFVNDNFFDQSHDKRPELINETSDWAKAVRVIDPEQVNPSAKLKLYADAIAQRHMCYFEANGK